MTTNAEASNVSSSKGADVAISNATRTTPEIEQLRQMSASRILNVVAEHVQKTTRFDSSDLSETESEKAFEVPLALMLHQEASFKTKTVNGPAHLPTDITKVTNASKFGDELEMGLLKAQAEAIKAIDTWVNNSRGSYRRLMPPEATFLTAPIKVGYEHVCSICTGKCKLICTACHGGGWVSCGVCNGSSRVYCFSCGGSGQKTEQVSRQVWNSSTRSNSTQYQSVQKSCSVCFGSGRNSCMHCSNGQIRCGRCHATGKVDCDDCVASGIQHVWGTVFSDVTCEEMLSESIEDAALKRLVHEKLPRENLPNLGSLMSVRHSVHHNGVKTLHHVSIRVQRARIHALGKDFAIHGFGPDCDIFSFENIAGHMLADDLVALETCISSASIWRRHHSKALLTNTASFLRSEINMLIAEKVTDLPSTPQEAAVQVEGHFKGFVDSAYIERANSTLRTALARLYGSELTESAIYLCGISAITAVVLFGLGWPHKEVWPILALSLSGAGIAWWFLEWLTCRRIARRFETNFAQRVIGQLHVNGSIKRWRIGFFLAVTSAVCIAMYGATQLPSVSKRLDEQRDFAQANVILEQWPVQFEQDLSLRKYPTRKLLETKAEADNARAQVILAWQLILGADGAVKDIEAAGRWLKKAQTYAENDPLWQAANAVYVLNQDSMPDAIRLAARDLDRAADRGLVEARYWQARIYLEKRSPLFDPKRGLHALTVAADKRHAHAALQLGKLLATGEGTRRDVFAARNYFQTAAIAGLPEATAALQKLY